MNTHAQRLVETTVSRRARAAARLSRLVQARRVRPALTLAPVEPEPESFARIDGVLNRQRRYLLRDVIFAALFAGLTAATVIALI